MYVKRNLEELIFKFLNNNDDLTLIYNPANIIV